jgi:hypothetical protein
VGYGYYWNGFFNMSLLYYFWFQIKFKLMRNNPIPLKYRKNYHGALKRLYDPRDITLGDIAFVPDPNCPSWETGYDVEVKFGKMKREHQGNSCSCVGQGWSNYLQMLNQIECHSFTDLSARDIYSQIFVPAGGAYIRDGAKIAVNNGVQEESDLSSYMAGNPPDEAFMRLRNDVTATGLSKALKYQSKKFVFVDTFFPMTDGDWENVRQVIWQFNGFVSGYGGHCMYASGYGLKDGKKFIKFVNSYGEGSDFIWQDEKELYDITALVDLPNPPDKINMSNIYRDPNNQNEVYAVNNQKRSHIVNMFTLKQGAYLGAWIFVDGQEIPVCPVTIWNTLDEIAEICFTPKD